MYELADGLEFNAAAKLKNPDVLPFGWAGWPIIPFVNGEQPNNGSCSQKFIPIFCLLSSPFW